MFHPGLVLPSGRRRTYLSPSRPGENDGSRGDDGRHDTRQTRTRRERRPARVVVGTLGGGGQVEHAGRLGVDCGLRLEDGDDVCHRRGLCPGVELGVEFCHGGVLGDGEQRFLPSLVLGALAGIAGGEVVAVERNNCIPEPFAELVALPELLARDASLVDYVRDGDGAGVVVQVAGVRASRFLRRLGVAVADEAVALPELALLDRKSVV